MALACMESFTTVQKRIFHLDREIFSRPSETVRRFCPARISSRTRTEQNQPGQAIQELTITRVFASGQATTRRMFHSTVRYLPFQKTPSTSTCVYSYLRGFLS